MGKLSISRYPTERVRLRTSDGDVWIEVTEVHGRKVRFSLEAPASVSILREELITEPTPPCR